MKIATLKQKLQEVAVILTDQRIINWIKRIVACDTQKAVDELADEISYDDVFSMLSTKTLMEGLGIEVHHESCNIADRFRKKNRCVGKKRAL